MRTENISDNGSYVLAKTTKETKELVKELRKQGFDVKFLHSFCGLYNNIVLTAGYIPYKIQSDITEWMVNKEKDGTHLWFVRSLEPDRVVAGWIKHSTIKEVMENQQNAL